MMEILDIAMRDEKIHTMKLAFRCTNLEMVIMDLKFDGNRLAVDVSVANEHIRHLFEEEFYDFLYRFKKNNYTISSLNIHVGEDEKPCPQQPSAASDLKEKWLKVMYPETGSGLLDAFA
ncbi:MAG: hypothetical protein IKX02_03535 [Spirochaetales bacterium]|nr:hypothetical protein [Spirochaetales bacterium]